MKSILFFHIYGIRYSLDNATDRHTLQSALADISKDITKYLLEESFEVEVCIYSIPSLVSGDRIVIEQHQSSIGPNRGVDYLKRQYMQVIFLHHLKKYGSKDDFDFICCSYEKEVVTERT